MSYFLGTNFGHHSSTAAIDETGRLRFAVEEGRLAGQKDCATFPDLGLDMAVSVMGGLPRCWVDGWNWRSRLVHKGLGPVVRFGLVERQYLSVRLGKELSRFRAGVGGVSRHRRTLGKPIFAGHHRAHALSLLPWGLPKNALVMVSDTTGERESITGFHWNGEELVLLARSAWPNSLGSVYHQAAYHLGFDGERGPGKLMALSGYGTPVWKHELAGIASIERASVRIDRSSFPAYCWSGAWAEFGKRLGSSRFSRYLGDIQGGGKDGADFAASVQSWFTDSTLQLIGSAVSVAKERGLQVRALGLAGGAALNCQTNGAILRLLPAIGVERLVVSPWSNDAGTAVGAAVHGARLAGVREFGCESPLLGPAADVPRVSDSDVTAATEALWKGRVIGLINGGVELGPRALGGRCILADPRRPELKAKLNIIKGRPDFMPFAPVISADVWREYFLDEPASNMAWTVRVKPSTLQAFPGLWHPTGETRAQMVTARSAPLLDRVLREFGRVSAAPLLLLTSLNGSGDPMLSDHRASLEAARALRLDGCLTDDGWWLFGEPSNATCY
jgi:carbamoyltransferase